MVNSPIADIVLCSFLDFPGHISTVVFLRGCNFLCNFCFNWPLVTGKCGNSLDPDYVLGEVEKLQGWVDSVCLGGAEPTLHAEFLEDFCREFKALGLKVKLDTNGSNPRVMERLLSKDLIEFVAVDIKAPLTPEAYSKATGIYQDRASLSRVKDTIRMLLGGVPHLFRTTVVPSLHTREDILSIAREVSGAFQYVLQDFDSRDPLDPALKGTGGYGRQTLEAWAVEARQFVKKVTVLARD